MSNDNELLGLPEIPRREWAPSGWDKEASTEQVLAAIRGRAGGEGRIRAIRSDIRTYSRWMGYAAVCCILALASWRVLKPASIPGAYVTYATKTGQRASLTLVDGSRVVLGPLTILRVQKGPVSIDGVAVEVNGEALFNVSHSAKIPFTVTAHGVATRILGTEFVVRAYDASLVRVAVREGRVSVQSPVVTTANAAIVNAGESVTASPNALPIVAPISDMATDFAWANGELVLQNVPLGEALVRLSRWYGMEFRVTDPNLLKTKKIDAVFKSAFNQADIDVLGAVIKANVSRSGNVVTFSAIP